MRCTFTCRGHPNIRAEHNRTMEFTKDHDLTERGDCIVGISADFDPDELKKLTEKIRITIEVNDHSNTFKAYVNPKFDDDNEIVFRKSRYRSSRTLGTDLNKGSSKLDREIVRMMQDPGTVMTVTIETMKKES